MDVLHTGQSGVERGAWRAARVFGCSTTGVCTPNGRDEFGRLPSEVRAGLVPCREHGARAALRHAAVLASAMVVVVPNRRRIQSVPGISALLREGRLLGIPHWVADVESAPATLVDWLSTVAHPLRCLITGPRETRWSDGERVANMLVLGYLSATHPAREIGDGAVVGDG